MATGNSEYKELNQLRVSQEYFNMYVEKVIGVMLLFGRARPKLQRHGWGVGCGCVTEGTLIQLQYRIQIQERVPFHHIILAVKHPTGRHSDNPQVLSVLALAVYHSTGVRIACFEFDFFGFVLLSRQVTTVCTVPCLILISP